MVTVGQVAIYRMKLRFIPQVNPTRASVSGKRRRSWHSSRSRSRRVRLRRTSYAGHTGAQLVGLPLLLLTEEHVTMIDGAVDIDNVDLAQPALALAAVEHHVRAGSLESVEQRVAGPNDGLDAESGMVTANSSASNHPLLPKVS